MGATPEQLLKVNEMEFQTLALAGTQIVSQKNKKFFGKKRKRRTAIGHRLYS
jgi:isochorismate synthase EntC